MDMDSPQIPEIGQDQDYTNDNSLLSQTIETLAEHLAHELTVLRQMNGIPIPLLKQSANLEELIRYAYSDFTNRAEESLVVSYGGEWLLDNYYIIRRAIQQINEDMPHRYYSRLLKINAGELSGYAHVYILAQAFTHAVNSHVSIEEQNKFIDAYQQHRILTIGELWAWPTMLRIIILENLLRALDKLIVFENESKHELIVPIIQERYPLSEDPNLIVANCVSTLRAIDSYDWSNFVESSSEVEKILKRDPSGIYAQMDFYTRDCYRRQIETLAQHTQITEAQVAQIVLQLAEDNFTDSSINKGDVYEALDHVGYYLIDKGLKETKVRIGYRPPAQAICYQWLKERVLAVYFGGIALVALAIFSFVFSYAVMMEHSTLQLIAVFVISLIPVLSVAISLVNWLVSRVVAPAMLPKMDFSDAIPDDFRSIVVIPSLLTSVEEVQSLFEQLEQHYLRNTDQNLFFAILADFVDADQEETDEDNLFQEMASNLLATLNTRYEQNRNQPPFYFLLRKRQWNSTEHKWMGYERKRGKLAEFNRLLLNEGAETSYFVKLGNLRVLNTIRYVITLDADTILPPEVANRLVATMAHPLNQPHFDEQGIRVKSGYTVLQPRVEILPVAANHTLFTRIFSGEKGLDLYTLAVSNVYQDLFGEGIFVGKGIYDVAAFEQSLEGRTPEDSLLSHDLFEGLHGRAGLVTDIVLLEDYPTHYLAHIDRVHRWVRGDWQLLPWLLRYVPGNEGKSISNKFSFLDKWKILDNLIRSLLQPALLIIIVLGWVYLPGTAVIWTVFALLVLLIPFITDIFNHVVGYFAAKNQSEISLKVNVLLPMFRWALSVAFLPYEALIRLHAITITLFRLRTRKHLLEWKTAASVIQMYRSQSVGVVQQRMLGVVFALSTTALVAFVIEPTSIIISLPLIIAWFSGPSIAEHISQPIHIEAEIVTEAHKRQLRALSRRTWLFFEEFVGPNEHWLPPDHYQQMPITKVGKYTSPTNIGLMLVSVMAAYDQGYIGSADMMTRLQFAFESLSKLERYRGHLLNWYSTTTLLPLHPRYVSTVDNGNYAGSLLALQGALNEFPNSSIARVHHWNGLIDLIYVVEEIIDVIDHKPSNSSIMKIKKLLEKSIEDIEAIKDHPEHWVLQIDLLENETLGELTSHVSSLSENMNEKDVQAFQDLRIYLSRFQHHLTSFRSELSAFSPWLLALSTPPAYLVNADGEIGQAWKSILDHTSKLPQYADLGDFYETLGENLKTLQLRLKNLAEAEDSRIWCKELRTSLEISEGALQDLNEKYELIQQSIQSEFQSMNFGILYDDRRHLFHIGYNVENEKLDTSYYDLLASESRIASFLAIAKGDVPPEHWLHLSRPVAMVNRIQTLRSWSGTMFEYLMPLLFMRHYPNTLLDQSYKAVVQHQVDFGNQHQVPWGVSESGYYAFDSVQNYQYRAFGLGTLGLRREQEREVVIAPYASLLALSLAPSQVLENIEELRKREAITRYGLVEAVDYTASRLPLGQRSAIVKEYMAHHQGMVFISLANYLHDNLMVERFHSNALVKSVELLLMEQIPQNLMKEETEAIEQVNRSSLSSNPSIHPWDVGTENTVPQAHYISNGHYAVMITNSGSGYSQWKDRALTRWRAERTLDNWGQWIYLHEASAGHLWSPTIQPLGRSDSMKVTFHLSQVEFHSRAYDISSHMEVFVPPEDDVEIRKLALTNHTEDDREITICSYGEMVLAPQSADQRHQAFNKMFIESEYLPHLKALIFRRRLRASDDQPMYVVHMLIVEDTIMGETQYETDRRRFLGRNHTLKNPQVFNSETFHLSGTTGSTLDPIMALAHTIKIPAYSNLKVAFVNAVGDSREQAIGLAQRFRSWEEINRSQNQLQYKSGRELQNLGLKIEDIARFQHLLSNLLYPNPRFRADSSILKANTKDQSALWAYGVSGDYPLILVQVSDEEQLDLVYEIALAHRFWRNRGFSVTLIILNQRDTGYMQELYHQIHRLLVRTGNENWLNRHDGIFVLRAEQIPEADSILLKTSARVFLDGKAGTLQQQLGKVPTDTVPLPPLVAIFDARSVETLEPFLPRPENLIFDNGYGGFTENGHEYQIYFDGKTQLPAPWINVIANPHAGFYISESGGGFTWAENSGEHRLTTWRNDPVEDTPSEAIYLRDEETAEVWSPTPMPAGMTSPYLIRHGAGYSVVEHQSHDLTQTTSFYMAPDDPVKFVRLKLKNTASRPRRITITYYLEWVLGPIRDMTQQYLIPEFDSAHQTLLVHNPYSMEFGEHYAFVTADQMLHGFTSDRTEFIGFRGSLRAPAALKRIGLNSTVQAGNDICSAVQLHMNLPLDGEGEICFIMGSSSSRDGALALSERYRQANEAQNAWQQTRKEWRDILDSIVVHTPDKAMNVILPWLLYQALSCRIWGRSALYQSSGAFGFRDQLQDVMALLHVRPDLAREHILRAAQHQFEEGDVLHWWHPPSGRGVRTRFSDDLVWLPFVVSHYVRTSGDDGILYEEIPFLRGEELRPDEEERYGFYETTSETYTLYEHCRRALNRAYSLGEHNLPLMKAGDWNDGMNRVGIEGQGESVWMGWFLYMAMDAFEEISLQWDDSLQVDELRQRKHELKNALENSAWDGEWYRRAYYDDGTPLGSKLNDECQIDSLPQSWGVLSGAADKDRIQRAMESVQEHLIKMDDQLIKLFNPPFNNTDHDPGYIKGYPPGIRENGGQYTHAAIWVVWAFAEMGHGNMAETLFRMLNPIYHSDTPEKAEKYRVEPYVVVADVYSTPPHTGQGGWTWYTGSSGWMYRLGIEAILGLYREGSNLRIAPSMNANWERYTVDYRYGKTMYKIEILNPEKVECGVKEVRVDNELLDANLVPLVNDGVDHYVKVVLKP
ncbi:MAG: glucoamylase family protein [Aggregatilineales bacterium]